MTKNAKIFIAAGFGCAALLGLTGCGKSEVSGPHDYAYLINRSGTTGMKGLGPFAAGSNRHPGYPELPIEVGSRGAWAPSTGSHAPITALSDGSRGNGIANDSGGIGIGIH
jgi:hypothetical protein